ncbi:hypothetical protein GYO_1876 [Bacillus spizizenii TU-B-10]|uniref:Uncharacterized protein n=1 Tax=Bacillus spizizenii (strain DSM 15029 / JCM 12233 / NBRC 101239 / NRRL B-23049 / TU-B-10) TaxID=1052585 RepID=G4NS54_BACS4|nr:hypothetical protein GYO_1876 [Bacillus spizizenii TU-B-10]
MNGSNSPICWYTKEDIGKKTLQEEKSWRKTKRTKSKTILSFTLAAFIAVS